MGTKDQILAWYHTPEDERQPRTREELAYLLKCSEVYISQVITGAKPKKQKDNSDFDLKAYLRGNLKEIASSLLEIIKTSKNAKAIELALKALGELVEKREDTHKFELTPTDYANIGRATIDGLRADLEQFGGICTVCGQHKALRLESRLDTESEQSEDREVATVAVSARSA